MDYGRPNVSTSTGPAIPDEYYAIGARYADRRGRVGAMASLGAESIASLRGSISKPAEVLYPETSKLSGGLLASLIRCTSFHNILLSVIVSIYIHKSNDADFSTLI